MPDKLERTWHWGPPVARTWRLHPRSQAFALFSCKMAGACFKLVGNAGYRSFRNVWMLEELQVAYDYVPATPHSAEANAANPFGKIPSLVHGDFVMYESVAINTYLGDVLRGQGSALAAQLVPAPGTPARGLYDQVTCCLLSEMDAQALWIHRKHEALGHLPHFGAIPEAVAHARGHFDRVIRVQAAELARGGTDGYILGAQFSAADVLLVHCLNWAEAIGWGAAWQEGASGDGECRCELPSIAQYLLRCRARPAYLRATARKEGG